MPKLFVQGESLAAGSGKSGTSHAPSEMPKKGVLRPGRDEYDLERLRLVFWHECSI